MSGGLYFYDTVVEAQLNRPAKVKPQRLQSVPADNVGGMQKKLLAAAAKITKMLWH